MRKQQPFLGTGARWLLLLLTAFGLTMMHTLGHAGMQMNPPAATVAGTLEAHAPATMPDALPCSSDYCQHHSDPDAWNVCLAVLGGLAIIVVIASHLAARRRAPDVTAAATMTTTASRSPPGSPTGLAIGSTAVLRI